MKMMILALTLFTVMSACSTKKIHISPDSNLKNISTGIQLGIDGGDVDPAVINDLKRYLMAKLIIAGFDIDTGDSEAIRLQVDVHSFSPGNAGLRLTVGFGAGRGSLLYTAQYFAPDGTVLAAIDGQEYFTGSEIAFGNKYGAFATMGGAEKAQSILVQEAAEHIVELALGAN
jgi:hypothetical protein